jgi:hypothetical protein
VTQMEGMTFSCHGFATDNLSKAIDYAVEIVQRIRKDVAIVKNDGSASTVIVMRHLVINGGV